MALSKNNLGYLGIDFQYRLIKAFFERPQFFKDMYPIINQNMFTGKYLNEIVGSMKDYYEKHNVTASYDMILIKLKEKSKNDDQVEFYEENIEKIKSTTIEGIDEIQDLAEKFFKQQNLIRVANYIIRIAGDGDIEKYDKCQEMVAEALSIGSHENEAYSPLDNIEEDLSKENVITIPTGISKLDDCLGGGLDVGKIGLIMGPTSFGKALADNEYVMTPDGPKFIKYINVGDFVIGGNGKPTKVIGVFPQGVRDIYKVTFSDGTTCRCDKEHIWSVNTLYQKEKGTAKLRNLTLDKIMKKGLRTRDNRHRFEVPVCECALYGTSNITDIDEAFDIICDFSASGNSGLGEQLYNEIITSDVATRHKILIMLMDRFGESTKNDYPYFTNKSERLCLFVRQIVLSLGGFSKVINDNKISVCFKHGVRLFTDNEKQWNVKYLSGRAAKRYIEKVEFVNKQNATCIKVENEDGLFLTNDYVITHNTSMTTGIAAYAACYKCEANDFEGYKVLQMVFEDSNRDIDRKYFSRLTQVETSRLNESEETTQKVKEALLTHPDREMIRNNIRVMKLETGEFSATDILNKIRNKINEGFKPQLVIIDYLECINAERGTSSLPKHEQETKTMRKLENGVKDLGIALWLPSQGNRGSISSELVTMDQGAGSIGKQQISQVVISITRSVDDINNQIATLSVLKNRSGKAGIVLNGIKFNNGTCTITCDDVTDFDDALAYDDYAKEREEEIKRGLIKQTLDSYR